MRAQQHRIMRQVVEARDCPPEAAERIQDELHAAWYDRLVPVIDGVCSELSDPAVVHRIDTLEIDLGAVPLSGIGEALAGRLEEALRERLAGAIGDAPQVDAELELFAWFVRTGSLPWWAERSEPELLERTLRALVRRAPRALRAEIPALLREEPARRRTARAWSDDALEELSRALAPALPAGISSLPARVAAAVAAGLPRREVADSATPSRPAREVAPASRAISAREARLAWWEEVLLEAASPRAPREAVALMRSILAAVAERLGVEYPSLVVALGASPPGAAEVAPSAADEVMERLRREEEPAPARPRGGEPPEAERSGADPATRRSAPHHGSSVRSPDEPASADWTGRPGSPLAAAEERAAHREVTIDPGFGEVEALYLGNAGLVVLWPFLEHFFERLGLVEERRFASPAAAQRAVGLLQYVAAGDECPPEYLLPLNKVLCGLAPDEPFDFGPDLTDEEREECVDLLAAVIQQAPILGEMSVGGFRASFLLREGQLSARDGAWLLRVERETHDLVLDRFPWSVHLVALPWMEAFMQVEW